MVLRVPFAAGLLFAATSPALIATGRKQLGKLTIGFVGCVAVVGQSIAAAGPGTTVKWGCQAALDLRCSEASARGSGPMAVSWPLQ